MQLDAHPLGHQVIGAAIAVHSALGPGLLESIYHRCMRCELRARGIPFRSEVRVPVVYRHIDLGCGHRIDLVVDESLVIEIKSVERLLPVHSAQILTYMRLTSIRHGILFNFHAAKITEAMKSFVLPPANNRTSDDM